MSSQDMEDFKKELMGVISKYFLIEQSHLQIDWERTDSETALVINTPVIGRPLCQQEPRAAAAG